MMNKTSLKIFICFTLTSAIIAVILLCVNFLGYAYIASDSDGESPKKELALISKNLTQSEDGFELKENVLTDNYWCILLDENGDIIWSQNRPDDIPSHYSINDVAKMTRWYLNDYPVYVRTEDYGLLVLGIPKNAVGKYEMIYSMRWFDTLPKRILTILAVNLCFAFILACIFGFHLYRRLRALTDGIADLRKEKPVRLPERGIFKEISANINRASGALERKNTALAARDSARSNWISGISHDIRTPLSVIVGYSDELCKSENLTEAERNKAEAITMQGVKIKKLIEDLNIISSLEYDMQPSKKSAVRICPLLRRVVSDILNSKIAEKCTIDLDLKNEKSTVAADENLIERAMFNLINNSIKHNEKGCNITIKQYEEKGMVIIGIFDNGKGIEQNVIDNIDKIPKTAHGLGLPMAYRIIKAHGGKLSIENNNGVKIQIKIPSA